MGLTPEIPVPLPLGQGRCLQGGNQISLVAVGYPVHQAQLAAQELAKEGISVGVYDMRFIKPLDEQLLRTAANAAPMVLTLEENTVCGGFGAAALEFYARDGILDKGLRIRNLGIPDRNIPHGSQNDQRASLGLDSAGITETVRKLLYN
jgi:1-deoxy-D-xylulose-5-phosphate synthase